MFELGLEADDVPQRAERIILPELDDGMGPAPGFRIIEADRLHRAEAQGFRSARRHHLHRHAAFEIRRVLLPLLELGFLARQRSEEHTSELQSLMRISYAVFCLKKKNKN